MSDEKAVTEVHPEGEPEKERVQPSETALSLDTFAGKIQFRWAPDAEVSGLGQMAFFIEFLKTSGLFDNWVSGVNYFFGLTTIISPYQRQLLFYSFRGARIARFRAEGGPSGLPRQACFRRGRQETPTITPSSFRNPFLPP